VQAGVSTIRIAKKNPLEKTQPRHEDAGEGGGVFPNKEKDSFEKEETAAKSGRFAQ
jgi:hypothetical protein